MYSRSKDILQLSLSFHISWRMKGIPRGILTHKGLNQTSKTEERERERWRALLRARSAVSISTNA